MVKAFRSLALVAAPELEDVASLKVHSMDKVDAADCANIYTELSVALYEKNISERTAVARRVSMEIELHRWDFIKVTGGHHAALCQDAVCQHCG